MTIKIKKIGNNICRLLDILSHVIKINIIIPTNTYERLGRWILLINNGIIMTASLV